MKKTIVLLYCILLVVSTISAQRNFSLLLTQGHYKTFVDCSKPKHPMLVKLKGNVASITQNLPVFYSGLGFGRTYFFENNKLIKEVEARSVRNYIYDKNGYLTKILTIGLLKKMVLYTDSLVFEYNHELKRLVRVFVGNASDPYFDEFKYDKNSISSSSKENYVLDDSGLIVEIRYPFGGGNNIEYELDNDKRIQIKKQIYWNSTPFCDYVSTYDEYNNLIAYGCNNVKTNYEYLTFDEKGNWTFGKTKIEKVSPNRRLSDGEYLETTRTYTYHN